ncbi:MAG: flippase-like domain-containing protein [Clostridiales bacterium]|nr:flippase-like domain-containing protein [Clostridiales bacterium]
MDEIRNTKVDNYYNVARSNIKLKKRSIEKLRSDIKNNSRVFFSTLRRINEETLISETLDRATTLADKPKSRKKKIFSAIMTTLNIILLVLVFYSFAHEQGGIHPLSELLFNEPKWKFLLVAIGLYFVTVMFNSLKFVIFIKSKTGRFRPIFSLKLATIGRYYDLITPLGSGGQPFEIYYLKKNGYSADTSTAIPVAKYMIWQFSFFLFCLGILIAYSRSLIESPLLLVFGWVGLSVVLLIFLFVLIMSISQKIAPAFVVWILKLLHKMHIIKNYRITLIKVLKFVKSYQLSIKSLIKNPLIVMAEVFVTILGIISNALIAYFIYIAFADTPSVKWWDIVCKCCICELASCFIPLPGGSGAQELSFNALLGSLFKDGALFWGVLFWRILTYYMYIAQGALLIVTEAITNKFRNKGKSDTSDESLAPPDLAIEESEI